MIGMEFNKVLLVTGWSFGLIGLALMLIRLKDIDFKGGKIKEKIELQKFLFVVKFFIVSHICGILFTTRIYFENSFSLYYITTPHIIKYIVIITLLFIFYYLCYKFGKSPASASCYGPEHPLFLLFLLIFVAPSLPLFVYGFFSFLGGINIETALIVSAMIGVPIFLIFLIPYIIKMRKLQREYQDSGESFYEQTQLPLPLERKEP